jgi:sulfopyruvate decarboxylase TPP-binding subunit
METTVDPEARLDKIDRRLESMTKLMRFGMRMLLEHDGKINALIDAQIRTEQVLEKRFTELAEAQRRTEESLKAFIDSMRRSGNGRKKS